MKRLSQICCVFIFAVCDFCSKVVNVSVFKDNELSYVNCSF